MKSGWLGSAFTAATARFRVFFASGLGGPSRYLAANYGCRVIGIDITGEYCRIASVLAARMGLEDRVEYRRGDAREALFPGGTFDGAWTQHVSMKIAEKKELYEGICRVLKNRGRFAPHDVVQRTPGAILFPVPWARTLEINHLQSAEAMRTTIVDAGLNHSNTAASSKPADLADNQKLWVRANKSREHFGPA